MPLGYFWSSFTSSAKDAAQRIKESASSGDATTENVKGRFQPNALVKQGRNQISEGHVCCFKGSSYSLVMCLRERQVTRVLGVFCLVWASASSVFSQGWWQACEQNLHHKTHPGFLATGNPPIKAEQRQTLTQAFPSVTTLTIFQKKLNKWTLSRGKKQQKCQIYTLCVPKQGRADSVTRLACCSVAQLCPTFWNPVDCSMPGFPVLHHVPELAQTHVHKSVMPSNHLVLCFTNSGKIQTEDGWPMMSQSSSDIFFPHIFTKVIWPFDWRSCGRHPSNYIS